MVLTVMPLRRKTTPMMPITRPMVKKLAGNFWNKPGINDHAPNHPDHYGGQDNQYQPVTKGKRTLFNISLLFTKKRSDSCTRDRRGFFFTREAYTHGKDQANQSGDNPHHDAQPEPESTGTPAIP
ncbi:Uncharacterised protein [Escherichia coli]|uniref:Uncharacterized protein n=1 Tax=Escherichia coli TaxID=562 RepID=A0A2X3K7E5_ECOLX|nr:Uncharacterised protein [Escherichia coli]